VVRDAFGVSSSRESFALSNDLAALLTALRCLLTASPFAWAEARSASRLTSAVFPEPVAPFSPTHNRWINRHRVGLKGAALSTNPGDVSTGGREAAEARNETRESRERGLSGSSQSTLQQSTHKPNHRQSTP